MKKSIVLAMLLLLTVNLFSCRKADYTYTNVVENSNKDALELSYECFSGERSVNIKIGEGRKPIMTFNVVTVSGSLGVYVKDMSQNYVYVKNSVETSEFKIELESAGRYIVTLIGKDHKGSCNVKWSSTESEHPLYVNPYINLSNGEWKKVNFHTHAGTGPGTCGSNNIDVVVDAYRKAGFSFLAISNHDLFTNTEEFTNEEMTMIPGVEYSVQEHMVTVGVDRSLHEYDHQTAINMTNEMGGFTIIAHPNWPTSEFWNYYKLTRLKGYVGIEVINMLIDRLPTGEAFATNIWDYLLTRDKLVYGFANDDMHQLSDVDKSYNIIYTEKETYEAMKNAIDKGQFCASSGLFPEYLVIEGDTIKVKAKHPVQSDVTTFTYKFITENGKVLHEQTSKEGQYTIKSEKYIRVEVISDDGAYLMFQPVYLKDTLSPP